MNGNLQSGKTQAIDLDELRVESANRPIEREKRGEFDLDKWGDDPWASTEESRKRRRWADDEKWAGDDAAKRQDPTDHWDVKEENPEVGWHAQKRHDVMMADDEWSDWNNYGGEPKKLDMEEEDKDFGGYRRVQAASQYQHADTSDYVDGRAQRDDLYRTKEAAGTAGLRERRGGFDERAEQLPMPDLKPVSTWGNEEEESATGIVPSVSPNASFPMENDDMRASATISNQNNASVDDIPGRTRASIIIFQAQTEPVVYELKKLSTSIGRGLDNLVILNDQYASRKHLALNYVSGRFELFALSPDNLVTVNNYPISHVVLMNNDQIELGATRIRFVLGPISDVQMTLTAPINGRPIHLDDPPQETRSPKTTRKNLILLISVISMIIVIMIVALIVIAMGAKKVDSMPEVAAADEADSSDGQEAEQAPPAADDIKRIPDLEGDEKNVLSAMMQGISGGIGRMSSGNSAPFGKAVSVKITTSEDGARIYNADGSLRGITPYTSHEFVTGSGSEQWIIRKDGFEDYRLDVQIGESVKPDEIKLVALAPAKPAKPAAKPPARKSTPAKKKPSSAKPKPGAASRPGGRRVI